MKIKNKNLSKDLKSLSISKYLKDYLQGREKVPRWINILVVLGAVLTSFIVSVLISSIIIKDNPFKVVGYFFEGAFSRPIKLLFDAAVILAFGVAIVPCFKMKYWNMGSNGQFLISAVVCISIMKGMGDFGSTNEFCNIVVIVLMLVASIVASMFWAQIPAIFKALFNTNETLFTLMMNYIAAGILTFTNISLSNGNSSTGKINYYSHVGWLTGGNSTIAYIIVIVSVLVMSMGIYVLMTKSKAGFETIVLGDSFKTAKYVAMDTKRIINRTAVISGFVTGVLAFLLVSAVNQSASNAYSTISFNAILVGWMSNFNPFIMTILSLFLSFVTNGMSEVTAAGGLGSSDLVNLIFGIIFFAILASEFFIKYRVKKSRVIDNFLAKKARAE